MTLTAYFARDIANVLRATSFASEGGAGLALDLLEDPELRAALDAAGIPQEKLVHIYRQGFHTALVSVGLAFGLVPQGELRQDAHVTECKSREPAGLPWAEAP